MESCYCDHFAQDKVNARKRIPRHHKLGINQKLTQYVDDQLIKRWSPEIISQRMKKDYLRKIHIRISHVSIYERLYRDAVHDCQMYKHLVRSHKKRSKQYKFGGCRGSIKNRIDISERPIGAQNRSRFGHCEGDAMEGAHHKDRILLMLNENLVM